MKDALPLPPDILRQVAYPVEPFRLELVPRELPPPLLKGERNRLWQQPGLFDQLNDGQADQFEYIHKVGFVRARRGIH